MKDVNATIIVNIKDKNEEDVLKMFDYSRRKNINKAIKSGLKIEKTNSEEDYKKCYEMYSKTIFEGGSTPFSYDVWKNWAEKEKWELFAIKKDNLSVGYFSVIIIDKTYYGIDSKEKGIRPRVFASDKNYDDCRTNDLIYWGTIKYGLDKKVNFVDLGGYQINPQGHLNGVNSFKEKWGGEIFYYTLSYSLMNAIARKMIRNFKIFWKINEFLKKRKPKKPIPFNIKNEI